MSYPVPLTQAQADVVREIERQEHLKQQGKFKYTCKDKEMTNGDCLAVLAEEFGEVGTEILALKGIVEQPEDGAMLRLRKELIQVAAVATNWAEGIPAR